MHLNTYLNFNGQCQEAFRFYETALGGRIDCMMLHRGTPAEAHAPAEWLDKVLHARLNLNGQVIMASDCPPDRYQAPQGFSVTLGVPEAAEAERIFRTLAQDGKVTMPIQETFWAVRFGMVVDRFGIPWMINCEKAVQPQPEDLTPSYAAAR